MRKYYESFNKKSDKFYLKCYQKLVQLREMHKRHDELLFKIINISLNPFLKCRQVNVCENRMNVTNEKQIILYYICFIEPKKMHCNKIGNTFSNWIGSYLMRYCIIMRNCCLNPLDCVLNPFDMFSTLTNLNKLHQHRKG